MPKIHLKNVQNAQGMVEFALVMPILLLVILGIFAFGHLFFAYSTVVSASREAARYGAVVGLSENNILRYQDCAGIRNAAVRVGTFAGVSAVEPASGAAEDAAAYEDADPGIFIGYDKGPDTPIDRYCHEGENGPQTIDLGDRILVRVTVQYQSIVPLIDIPPFPLSATTARTIVRSLPVGEAPTAYPGCISTAIGLNFTYDPLADDFPAPAPVGDTIIPLVNITASDGSIPPGSVNITDMNETSFTCNFPAPSNDDPLLYDVAHNPCRFTYMSPGAHYYQIVYTPPNDPGVCYMPAVLFNVPSPDGLVIVKAQTITEIVSVSPSPSKDRETVTINFRVRATTPGGGVPLGRIDVSDNAGNTCDDRNLVSDGTTWASGSCTIRWNATGEYDLIASYTDTNRNPSYESSSSAPWRHLVLVPTATLRPTPTATSTATPTRTPLAPITPEQCPSFNSGSFTFAGDSKSFTIGINNPNVYNYTISSIQMKWPGGIGSGWLTQIQLGSSDVFKAQNNNANIEAPSGGPVTIDSSRNRWSTPALNAGSTATMNFLFTNTISSGAYYMSIDFVTADGRHCVTSPVINYTR